MSKQTQAASLDLETLAEDARALMAATADVAGDKADDETVRANPCQAIAIGVGVGALIGYLIGRKCSRNCD